MPSIIAQAGKQAIETQLQRYAPTDPLYEYYVDESGKQKRRKAGLLYSVKSLGLLLRTPPIARVASRVERARRSDPSLCQEASTLPRQRLLHLWAAIWLGLSNRAHPCGGGRRRCVAELLPGRPPIAEG